MLPGVSVSVFSSQNGERDDRQDPASTRPTYRSSLPGMRLSRTITANNRPELVKAVEAAPVGAQFDLVDDPRTTAQNRLMWGLLSDISDQVMHCGEKWEPDDYKCAFLKAMGVKCRIMPALRWQGGWWRSAIGRRSFQQGRVQLNSSR